MNNAHELAPFVPEESWKEHGVGFILAHPDDEVLQGLLIDCLC